jgi:sugar-specific transcriptional regulator TrmB
MQMTLNVGSDTARDQLRDALIELGFSHYEAKCYAGLVGTPGLTGYGVAKATGVPQPKVYENLRRLVRRGAARQIGDDPVLFVATPPTELLGLLDAEFRGRYGAASEAATHIESEGESPAVVSLPIFTSRESVMTAAEHSLSAAERRVYMSASVAELAELLPALRSAVERGVDAILLDFGPERPFEEGMRVFRHASTERALFRHHQARHLALVVDSRNAINAIAVDGSSWEGVQATQPSIIAAIKGMIRHDIDVQQIYDDFRPQLIEAYGAGLQALESYRVPAAQSTAADVAAGASRRRA